MGIYKIISAKGRGSFSERLNELCATVGEWLCEEHAHNRKLIYVKVFLSDAQNQYQQLVESELFQESFANAGVTIVEQPPVDGSKISLLLNTDETDNGMVLHSMRLADNETNGANSYIQTMMLFEKYIKWMEEHGLKMDTHLVRTWIYVADIDVNYAGMVRARNDIFKRYGLSPDTHFIASTGIGGYCETRSACVAIDFLTYPGIEESDKTYLKALDHLNPTHEYGVAFERGTRLSLPDCQKFYISGTASIDKHGHVIYLGDVLRQEARLLENIGALLKDGGATMADVKYFIVYLRDISDYDVVEKFLTAAYPDVPHVIVQGKVCRPEWLIEMECVAEKSD